MNKCKGRSVSDVSNKYKIPFEPSSLKPKFYHIPIECKNNVKAQQIRVQEP